MVYIYTQTCEKNTKIQLIKMFYDFYQNLNGKSLVRKINKIDIERSLENPGFLDRFDTALKYSIAAVKQIDADDISLLLVKDNEGNIVAVSRNKIVGDSLIVPEILVGNAYEKSNVIMSILRYYEEIAIRKGEISQIALELPWFDNKYITVAEESGYCFPGDIDFDRELNTTIMVSKFLEKVHNNEEIRRARKRSDNN